MRSDEHDKSLYSAYNGSIKAYEGVISVGDLLLARIPQETVDERNAHYKRKTDQQTEAWETDPLREQHPSMPMNKIGKVVYLLVVAIRNHPKIPKYKGDELWQINKETLDFVPFKCLVQLIMVKANKS